MYTSGYESLFKKYGGHDVVIKFFLDKRMDIVCKNCQMCAITSEFPMVFDEFAQEVCIKWRKCSQFDRQ